MKKHITTQSLNFKKFFLAFATGTFLPLLNPIATQAEMVDSPKSVVDEVWQIVHREYVDGDFNQVDWQRKRTELLSRDYRNTRQAYEAIEGALKDLGDPYTRFLAPDQFETLTNQTSGRVSGVGIRMAIDQRTQDLYVVEAIRKSPAAEMGLRRGDRIVRIDGKPTALMDLEQASEAMQGDNGTDVRLQIARQGESSFEVVITRAEIQIPAVDFGMREEGDLKIGYIKLEEFSSNASAQMEEAITSLQENNASAFVLDLRGNPGGLLFASVDIARMWMEEGEIVDVVDRRGGHRRFHANNSALTDLPLVVLVDGNSASASEILAGALKENNRATVVGTNTFGKGTVQSVHSLSDGSGLAVTISRYFPPSGLNISKNGIAPNVVQNISRQQLSNLRDNPSLIGTSSDPQYYRAISVLRNLATSSVEQNPLSRNY
ncbi:PDZ domain-containing protein [Cyanobacterium stanieri LEGE 03274]|uniref:PDZ domain-containing protein n=1 Tax=Cyanobacterium stanieri LEGE 03274 TaxID=1828756 RepID=A0ABR9V4Q4_9CHRO|nr:carboxyl-terminal processing protease CtpB [Cyanobacterium stanieri]MBE9222526.1 PDZ domain-containing protein [Cyanobacterium stanieri LEGE 03274]